MPGPYRLVAGLPLLDLAVPARFPLICVPVLAILLALSLDRRPAPRAGRRPAPGLPVRLLWTGAVAAALLPLAPTPIRTVPVGPVPDVRRRRASWRRATCRPAGPWCRCRRSPGRRASPAMLWSARTGLAFTAPGGYFIGPAGPADPAARWGAPDRPDVACCCAGSPRPARCRWSPTPTGARPIEDLRHWRAAVVVQGGLHHGDPVRQTVDAAARPAAATSPAPGSGTSARWPADRPVSCTTAPAPRTSQSQTSSTRCAGPSRPVISSRSTASRGCARRAPPPRPSRTAGPRPPGGGSRR